MVSSNYYKMAEEFNDLATELDFGGGTFLLAVGGSGALLAQEVSQRVLPYLNMSSSPSTARGLGASAGVMVALAVAMAYASAMVDSDVFGGAFTGMGVGAFILAGVTLFDAVQRAGVIPGNSPTPSTSSSTSSSGTTTPVRRTASQVGNGSTRRALAAGSTSTYR